MARSVTRDEALLKMASLCARSEQCEFDITRKLRVKGFSTDDISYIIDELKERRFIDNLRFATAFARDKVRFSSWGKMKIRAALLAHRIPVNLINEAFEQIDTDDYREAVMRSARSAAMTLDLSDRSGRLKLLRRLMSRGFESELANMAVRELCNR